MEEEGEMGKQLKMRKLSYSSESHWECVWEWATGVSFSLLGDKLILTPIKY